ncbi:phosphatase PAP2 family protein [Candidatus Saccharibacteria bacterium]|nr:phosphatase PAP2 family protein [Candidatus Saccharibacteria bacterium]MBQ6313453.1 phosphatase PAP2 family protein [Candidatus Saccharibacteria bacterium]
METWKLITDIILISAIAILGVFAVLGLIQWIKRKSFKKVDKELRWMPLPLALMAAIYLIFDKVLPKFFDFMPTRPNGSGEPSFPSTHVMVVATIFFLVFMVLPKYVENKTMRIILEILMLAGIILTCIGRVLANMHWPLDVFGGIVFAFFFAEVYILTIKERKKSKK